MSESTEADIRAFIETGLREGLEQLRKGWTAGEVAAHLGEVLRVAETMRAGATS